MATSSVEQVVAVLQATLSADLPQRKQVNPEPLARTALNLGPNTLNPEP